MVIKHLQAKFHQYLQNASIILYKNMIINALYNLNC